MSHSFAPAPADDSVLPVSTSSSDHSQAVRRSSDSSWSQRSRHGSDTRHPFHHRSLRGAWRHTIGIVLLLTTVVLWTASNFLASVGAIDGKPVAVETDKLTSRLSLLTIATPNHISLPMSTHHSSPSCCYSLLQGGYGPAADLCEVLVVNTPPVICLLLERKSKTQLSLTMMEPPKERVGHRMSGY